MTIMADSRSPLHDDVIQTYLKENPTLAPVDVVLAMRERQIAVNVHKVKRLRKKLQTAAPAPQSPATSLPAPSSASPTHAPNTACLVADTAAPTASEMRQLIPTASDVPSHRQQRAAGASGPPAPPPLLNPLDHTVQFVVSLESTLFPEQVGEFIKPYDRPTRAGRQADADPADRPTRAGRQEDSDPARQADAGGQGV